MGDKNIAFVDRGNVKVPMHNNCNATYETARNNINESNTIACQNPNKYPILKYSPFVGPPIKVSSFEFTLHGGTVPSVFFG